MKWTLLALLAAVCELTGFPSSTLARVRGQTDVLREFLERMDGEVQINGKAIRQERDALSIMAKSVAVEIGEQREHQEGLRRRRKVWKRRQKILSDFVDSRRARREIFGEDNRLAVSDYYLRRHPFSTMVKISTGCTGMLVSRHHVLTAAHCLHEKNDYKANIRVGVPIPEGRRKVPNHFRILRLPERLWPESVFFEFYDVLRADVPYPWIVQAPNASLYDFGLITLKPKSCIKRPYLKLQGFPVRSFHYLINLSDRTLSFGAFEDDRPRGTLAYRTCNVERVDRHGLLYLRCDATPGSSGAGVYTHIAVRRGGRLTTRRRLIGIFSGNRVHPQQAADGTWGRYNVATGITPSRLRQICTWVPELCSIPDWRDRTGVKLWLLGCKNMKTRAQKNTQIAATAVPTTSSTPTTQEDVEGTNETTVATHTMLHSNSTDADES